MPIYVAYHYNGKPIDVVLAAKRELAIAYWHGKDVIPHSTREISDQDLNGHPTGVLPIMSAKEKEIYKDGSFKTFLVVEK